MPFQAHEATLYVPLELNRWLANLDHLLCNLIGLRNNEKGGRAKEKETSWFVEIINFWSVAAISRMEENLTRVDTTATCSLKRRVRLWASLCAPCFRNATKIRSLSLSPLSAMLSPIKERDDESTTSANRSTPAPATSSPPFQRDAMNGGARGWWMHAGNQS